MSELISDCYAYDNADGRFRCPAGICRWAKREGKSVCTQWKIHRSYFTLFVCYQIESERSDTVQQSIVSISQIEATILCEWRCRKSHPTETRLGKGKHLMEIAIVGVASNHFGVIFNSITNDMFIDWEFVSSFFFCLQFRVTSDVPKLKRLPANLIQHCYRMDEPYNCSQTMWIFWMRQRK